MSVTAEAVVYREVCTVQEEAAEASELAQASEMVEVWWKHRR